MTVLADAPYKTITSPPGRAGASQGRDRVPASSPVTARPLTGENHASDRKSLGYCGKGAIVGSCRDRSHVVIIPIYCKAWDCPTCGPKKKTLAVKAFIAGKPTREITLTTSPTPGQSPKESAAEMKQAWRQLVAMIRRRFKNFEYALVFELTKKNRPHMHVLYRGEYIPQKWISIRWQKLGIGKVVHIQKIKHSKLSALHLAKYLVKHAARSATAFAPLHILQFSQGYLPSDFREPKLHPFEFYYWTFTRSSPAELLKDFSSSDRCLFTATENADLIEIYLHPSTCNPSNYEISADWILAPHAKADPTRPDVIYHSDLPTFPEET